MAKVYNGKDFKIKMTDDKPCGWYIYELLESYLQSKGLETKGFDDDGVDFNYGVDLINGKDIEVEEMTLYLNITNTITNYLKADGEPFLFVELTFNIKDYGTSTNELVFNIVYDEFYCNFDFNGQLDVSEFEQFALDKLNQG